MRRRILIAIAGAAAFAYLLLTLPLAALFIQSEYFRFLALEQVSWKLAKLRPPGIVFTGDSITAGGRNWGLRMGSHPFATLNLAGSDYTVSQVFYQVKRAASMGPEVVSIQAGTNDVLSREYKFERLKADYARIFSLIDAHPGTLFLVTSVPPFRNGFRSSRITEVNDFLRGEAGARKNAVYVDLAGAIRETSIPGEELYVDNVHFDDPAYGIWAELVKSRLHVN